MRTLKQIGQVLAEIIYTCLYTGLLYIILVLPLGWLMTLSTKWMIMVLLLVGGVAEGLIISANALLMIPYGWLVKQNMVAYIISIVLVLVNLTFNDVVLWKNMLAIGGKAPIVFAVIITLLFIQAIVFTLIGITTCYSESRNNE